MAGFNDCFNIGSKVLCTTCFNQDVEGEVLAFDHNTKMLILKGPSKTSSELNDVYVLNVSLCSNVQVLKENNANDLEDPQKLNLEQLKIRLRNTVQCRQTYLKSKNADVSPEGQELYRVFAKQFKYNEVCWQGANIQIFKEVIVTPPYRVGNVMTSNNNLGNYIKKMIEQFTNTRTSNQETSENSSPTRSTLSSNNTVSNSPVSAN